MTTSDSHCLVPRPHFSSRPKHFWSRGPCENVSRPFASDTSPKRIDQEGLGNAVQGLGNDSHILQISSRACWSTGYSRYA